MYLKRLELCGFKSFADKTRLDFEPGITAIIGPNGCGKSNTADAIRWCLGEQSARSMRSHQMMDVIFGGSQSRQTTGMAEVSLTFDNSQNVLPIDYSEVTITRRLFRSGESEYYINKVQCRLKDIRDLFLDTGIGTEGYAIIEQGKVEFVLSARPEERREMFEEAAGVSKYKVRREETLRKLEKVEVDMNRINDMLALLKEQIGTLDTAAKKAKQYQKYKEELHRQEVASIVNHIAKSAGEIERIKGVLEPKQKTFEEINTTLAQLEADLSQIRVGQVEKDEIYVHLQDEYSQVKSQINIADGRIQQAVQRETELKERQDTLTFEIENGTEKTQQYEKEMEQVQNLWQSLTEQVEQLEKDYKEKEGQLQNLRTKIEEYQQQENNIKNQLFTLASDKAKMHNEQNRLLSSQARCQAQSQSLQKELNRLNEQYTPLHAEITAKEAELEALRQRHAQLASQKDGLETRIAEAEAKLSAARASQTNIKEKLVAIESKQQMLKAWEQKDPVRTTMRSVMGLNLPGLKGPVSGVLHIDAGREEIVAAALGDKINYMICDTLSTAQAAIKYLQDSNLGRLTFVVMDRLPEAATDAPVSGEAQALLSLIKSDPEAEKIVRYLAGGTYIEGQSIYSAALVQGGGKITFDKPILIEEQLRHLAEDAQKLGGELSALTAEITATQEALTTMQGERKALEMEFQKTGVEIDWQQKNINKLKGDIQYLEKEINLNKNDLQNLEQEEAKIVEGLKNIENSLQNLETEGQKLSDQQQAMEMEVLQYREEENTLAPQLTEAKVKWATQCNELAGREREEQKLRETAASLKRQMEQFTTELAAIETKLVEQSSIQQSESERLNELHQELTRKEAEVQVSLQSRQELLEQLETKNNSLHTLRQQVEDLKKDIHDLELDQRSHEMQKQNLDQRLTGDFSLQFEEVKAQYENVEFDEEDIARLKRRIESMGAVNLAAPEEYASLEERYNFLLTQQQDLTKAKEDLHEVITKINQTTKENLKKTFDQVRENFRSLYHQLFEGGEADLRVTDEANLLEAGIEIFAQPPGKKFQNIALLSGGEKALTAISLLFAFFMVKPSPFCILDEVDAPLDDANIGRYNNLIRNFTSSSQFLVITHNKRSMEMAQVLYGVTMEELGVSKIISVKLNKDNENVAASA